MEGPALTVVGMAHAEFDGLPVLFVSTVLACDRIAARAVFRTVERYAVDGNRHFTESRCTLVIPVCFRAVGRIMTTGGVVDGRTWDGPLVILSTGAVVGLGAGQRRFKVVVWQTVGHNGDVGFVH